jgi:creatinine amidohydrolase
MPTGAIEQHGPHLPIDTDIFNTPAISEGIVKGFLQSENSVLVALPVGWGTSPHHLGFPGTLSLRMGAMSNILVVPISSMLRHGFYRF